MCQLLLIVVQVLLESSGRVWWRGCCCRLLILLLLLLLLTRRRVDELNPSDYDVIQPLIQAKNADLTKKRVQNRSDREIVTVTHGLEWFDERLLVVVERDALNVLAYLVLHHLHERVAAQVIEKLQLKSIRNKTKQNKTNDGNINHNYSYMQCRHCLTYTILFIV